MACQTSGKPGTDVINQVFDEGDIMENETVITCPFCPDAFLVFDADVDAFVCPECGIDIRLCFDGDD